MQMLFPDAKFRSPTAVDGKSDMRDENVYSSVVVTDGGQGNTSAFTVARGQPIPVLGDATAVQAHQRIYTELTTNISQNGQLGAAIGDSAFRAIGITIEQGYYDASGVLNTYGAGLQQVSEILAKTFFQLRIAGKLQIQGPSLFFPASGAAFGSIATGSGATGAVAAVANNGWPGALRRLKLPILVGRTDTLEATYGVAGGSSLEFGETAQPTLVWFNIFAAVAGDAR